MMMKMLTKTLLLTLLITTVSSVPEPDYKYEYGDYYVEEYTDESVEYGDPPPFQMASQHLVANEGEAVVIPCQSTEETPYVLIVKKAAQGRIKEKLIFVSNIEIHRNPRYSLQDRQMEISKLNRSDAGTYICSLGSNPAIEVSHILDVQYAPRITKVTEEQKVRKGDSVRLECEAEGNPAPHIKWSKLEGHLPSGSMEEEGLAITLAEVDRHVEGTYVCTADNNVGKAASAQMSVTVEYPPEIITEKSMVRTTDGDTVELVCIVHARPAPSIEWTKDDAPLAHDEGGNHLVEQQNGRHHKSIKISQITEDDFGDYKCTARNIFGEVHSIISLSGLPKPPHFTSAPGGGEETSYTLTWDTESYNPITEYRLKYRKAKANDSTDEPGEWMDMTYEVNKNLETKGLIHAMKHKLDDLEGATDYNVSVQTKNQFRWGNSTEFNFSTRKEVAQPTEISGAASVGFSALLLVVPALLLRT